MSKYLCVICTKVISDKVIEKRHYSPSKPMPPLDEMVCSRGCSDKLRTRKGLYKQMSDAGASARSQAVSRSNQVKPRRKRQEVK